MSTLEATRHTFATESAALFTRLFLKAFFLSYPEAFKLWVMNTRRSSAAPGFPRSFTTRQRRISIRSFRLRCYRGALGACPPVSGAAAPSVPVAGAGGEPVLPRARLQVKGCSGGCTSPVAVAGGSGPPRNNLLPPPAQRWRVGSCLGVRSGFERET